MGSLLRILALACLSLALPGAARAAGGQITFQTRNNQDRPVMWRIRAEAGAVPENLSNRLDKIAAFPGSHSGPISVASDGSYCVFYSERFDADSWSSSSSPTSAGSSNPAWS